MPSSAEIDFVTVAGDLAMLPRATLRELSKEAEEKSLSASQLALRKGLLNAVQIEIVETMLDPQGVIPGYEILDLLGHGGMGVVYRARQTNLDREVALKTVLISQMGSAAAAARFEKEAVAVARLRHPNVVAAYDFGRNEGRLFFAMEFVAGDDVEQRVVKWGATTEEFAWGIARQAAAGLAHAKEHGIVHRDIKPSNLLLVKAPEGFHLPPGMPMVKIADFGLAYLAAEDIETQSRLTRADTTVGSPHYMAPEQLKSSAVDQRADIYALGATVFFMLAGQSPFEGMSLSQIFASKIGADSPRLAERASGVSAMTARLVADMMAGEPERRIGDYRELMARIDDLGLGQGSAGALPRASASTGTRGAMDETRDLPIRSAEISTKEMRTREFPAGPSGSREIAARDLRSREIETVEEPPTSPGLSAQKSAAVDEPKRKAPPRKLRLLFTAAVAIVLGAAGGLALWPLLFPAEKTAELPPPGPRGLVISGWGNSLFDGKSMEGWHQRSGGWTIKEHDELGIVLQGMGGLIVREIKKPEQIVPAPLTTYKLLLGTHLSEADAVEVHFGVQENPVDARAGGKRFVVRISDQGVQLGERDSDTGELRVSSTPLKSPVSRDAPHALELERQLDDWWITFDGQELGYVKVQPGREVPQIRLLAEGIGREAYFSDIRVDELGPP